MKKKEKEMVHRGYKYPLIPLPPHQFGYEGVVLEDVDTGKIQCHICGEWCTHIGNHIRFNHKDEFGKKHPVREYKDKFGIMQKTALVSQEIRTKLIETQRNVSKAERKRRVNMCKEHHSSGKNNKGGDRGTSAEEKNKLGICYLQLLETIKVNAIKLGRTPTLKELRGVHGQHINTTIRKTYGSYTDALKLIKLNPNHKSVDARKDPVPLTRGFLIQTIRDFREVHGRRPSISDTKNDLLPDVEHFNKEFKTFNKAVKAAFRK